ncbi:MAG: hypothetical protein AMS21_10355 [Gemmatimonas sp. SG8_38_2]|nr:MAG: hypothetical protein AMS21_10355 [Gemmatimonas sp. SG8_38_2]
MKLVLLMFLEEDEKCVNRLLSEQKVQSFSRMGVEGRGPGAAAGWTGEVQPYQSQMIMSILPAEEAHALIQAVHSCTGVQDPRHPIRAALLDVEQFTCCEIGKP